MSTIPAILFISVCSGLIGHGISIRKSNPISSEVLAPVLGFATIILITSSLFLLQVAPSTSLLIIALISAASLAHALKTKTALRLLINMRPLILSLVLLWLPYWIRFGSADYITGYNISNDSVIHALLSRGMEGNVEIKDKLYPSGEMSQYPIGAHSVINLVHSFFKTDIVELVFALGLLAIGFVSFPLKLILSSHEDKQAPKIINDILAAFGAATYYNLAMSYHGFLPQVTYVPFALTSLILLGAVARSNSRPASWGTALSALCGAAAIASYSFAGVALLGFGALLIPIGAGWKRHSQLIMSFCLYVFIFLGFNLTFVWQICAGIIGQTLGIGPTSAVLSESSSYGNLVGYLSPLMWTGIWWTDDYRFQNLKNITCHLFTLSACCGLALAAIGIHSRSIISFLNYRLLGSGFLAYILIIFVTNSPYPAGKIASFIAPLLTIMILKGAISLPLEFKVKCILLSGFLGLMLASNLYLLSNIAALPATTIESMKKIAADYKGKRLLVFSGNDWLLYALDSRQVDIVGLHYLPDKINQPVNLSSYTAVVMEKSDRKIDDYMCLKRHEYAPFVVCDLSEG